MGALASSLARLSGLRVSELDDGAKRRTKERKRIARARADGTPFVSYVCFFLPFFSFLPVALLFIAFSLNNIFPYLSVSDEF